jgi:hypothetical protein
VLARERAWAGERILELAAAPGRAHRSPNAASWSPVSRRRYLDAASGAGAAPPAQLAVLEATAAPRRSTRQTTRLIVTDVVLSDAADIA